ncbi:DUF6164 family protein [Arenimonas aestuarii]
MPTLLLNLRNVPDDEADEVRSLLEGHNIDYYETKPSLWGVSGGGLWLPDDSQATVAKAHLATYQAERGERMRRERAEAIAAGRAPKAWSAFREDPLRALATVLGILLMLGLVTLPFLFFARG